MMADDFRTIDTLRSILQTVKAGCTNNPLANLLQSERIDNARDDESFDDRVKIEPRHNIITDEDKYCTILLK